MLVLVRVCDVSCIIVLLRYVVRLMSLSIVTSLSWRRPYRVGFDFVPFWSHRLDDCWPVFEASVLFRLEILHGTIMSKEVC